MSFVGDRAERHPIVFAVAAALCSIALMHVIGRATQPASAGGWFVLKMASKIVPAIVAWLLLRWFGWTESAGLRSWMPGTWTVLWLPALVAMYQLSQVADSPLRRLAYAVPVGLAIGLAEELWFRGLILRALRPLGSMRATLLSAVLFALIHLSWLESRSVVSVVYMELYTFALGVLWAGLVVRTGSIWPGVIFHGVMDLAYYDSAFRERRFYEPRPIPAHIFLHAVLLTYGLYLVSTKPEGAADAEPPAPAVAS